MAADFGLPDPQLVRLADFVAARVIARPGLNGDSAPAGSEPPRLALQRREAAAALGVGVDTFDRHVRPLLKCVYVGDLRLWPVAELERYLDEQALRPCDDPSHNITRPPRRAYVRGSGTRG
jgi:hypothetical protein